MLAQRKLRATLETFLNQLFQQSCALCERPTHQEICESCWSQVSRLNSTSQSARHEQNDCFSWGLYEGNLKRAIAKLKYGDRPSIGKLLGQALGLSLLKQYSNRTDLRVIAIPLHPKRLVSRQYNQAEIIAKEVATILGCAYTPQGLQRHRHTPALHSLSAKMRESMLEGAFTLNQLKMCDRKNPILLVDDIYTTGATMREAQRVLEHHQFKVMGKAVLARPQKLEK